jgi:hypothetical protein
VIRVLLGGSSDEILGQKQEFWFEERLSFLLFEACIASKENKQIHQKYFRICYPLLDVFLVSGNCMRGRSTLCRRIV